MSEKTLQLIKDNEVKWVDFRFTDTHGKEQHVTYPSKSVDASTFVSGKMFDGSSIAGWKGINDSDMILLPDDSHRRHSIRSSMTPPLSCAAPLLSLLPVKATSAIRVRSAHAPRPI